MAMLFLKVVWIIVALTYVVDTWKSIWLIDKVGESNLKTINITFEDFASVYKILRPKTWYNLLSFCGHTVLVEKGVA
jgi:hypothetical protein